VSYPKTVDKFIPWSKAMVAGATVDKPNYGKTRKMNGSFRRSGGGGRKRKYRKNSRKNNATKKAG